jgi:flagellar hook-length control protein FliK
MPHTGLKVAASSPFLPTSHMAAGPAVVAQVAEQIVARLSQGSQQAMLELKPQELGHVHIDLVVQGEQVQVRIVTETPEVSALMQTHLSELRTALQQHNLELGTVSVDVNTREGGHGAWTHDSAQDWGTHDGGTGRDLPTQRQDPETIEHQRSATPWVPRQSGVSVWA